MSTAGEIIVQAFREGNFTPIGASSTAEELAESLPRLNSLVASLFGFELGEHYRDWPVPSAWTTAQEQRHPLTPLTETETTVSWPYPPQNSRLLVSITAAKTVYFPPSPSDGARMALSDIGSAAVNITLDGNGRLIEGGTTKVDVPSNLHGSKWLYRADLSNWIALTSITASTDDMPLPEEFDDLFVTGLAMRLGPRYGVALEPAVAEKYKDMVARLLARYKDNSRPKTAAELRTLLRTTP